MISLSLAKELKQTGLTWHPQLHDFFAIPGTELEDRIFVVSDMMIDVQQLFGQQMITFNGAVEWSLDHVLVADTVWMPAEAQLRRALEERLLVEEQPAIEFASSFDTYRCRIRFLATIQEFEAQKAGDAYGRALLYLLQQASAQWPPNSRPIA